MALSNCTRCGELFNRLSRSICPDCVRKEEEQVAAVMAFLRGNPDVTVDEVAEATGVESSLVLQLIREERVKPGFRGDSPGLRAMRCRSCSKLIESGVYCPECHSRLQRAFRLAPDQKSGGGADGSGASLQRMLTPQRRRERKD